MKPLDVTNRESIIISKIEGNKELLKLEKENVNKIEKKSGGDSSK